MIKMLLDSWRTFQCICIPEAYLYKLLRLFNVLDVIHTHISEVFSFHGIYRRQANT